nr:retinoic acid-induced protein 3-like [Pogona vitticeps]
MMANSTLAPPPGCGNIDPNYYFLCDVCEAWGISLETVAAAGIVACLAVLLTCFIFAWRVEDKNKKNMAALQFLFILGTLGILSLPFAFIIRLNKITAPTRFLLPGVLFALCFSCLLMHAFNLIRLVRGKVPYSQLSILLHALGLTFVQVIIAIQYIVLTVGRDGIDLARMGREQRNKDFVILLTYVIVLMVFAFLISTLTFCGPYKGWKKHGTYIFVTLFFSIAIWVAWISVLLVSGTSDSVQSKWDDPLIGAALVANGWVFLMMYTVPEICFLATPCKAGYYPPEKPATTQQIVEESTQAPDKEGAEEDVLLPPNGNSLQLENSEGEPHFLIPRVMLHPAYKQDMVGCSEAKKEPTTDKN